jgi:hypothetical protein
MGKGRRVDMRAVIRSGIACATAAVALAASVSCGDVARQGKAPVMIVIDSLEAASGADPGSLGGFLLSDVVTLVEQTVNGETVNVPAIFNDVGQATMRLVMKDQGSGGTGVLPSALNAVTLRRYHITYRRADGRNTPGVDVPWPVDGAVTATLTGGTVVVPFEMVRHQAKEEAPLRAMAFGGGRIFISTIAEVTFFGTDLAGNDVQTTGTISVSFGDYADPE